MADSVYESVFKICGELTDRLCPHLVPLLKTVRAREGRVEETRHARQPATDEADVVAFGKCRNRSSVRQMDRWSGLGCGREDMGCWKDS